MMDLTPLEERLAHLDRAIEDLSETVVRQEREISRLARRVDLLSEREAAREADSGSVPLADQPPPHW